MVKINYEKSYKRYNSSKMLYNNNNNKCSVQWLQIMGKFFFFSKTFFHFENLSVYCLPIKESLCIIRLVYTADIPLSSTLHNIKYFNIL